jgi:hypothetical protein
MNPEETNTALFSQLVTGHAQMALTFLGRLPNPQTGETDAPNTEAARLFIDQLEMIETKTKGNLTAGESKLLSQMLGMTRMAFFEVVEDQAEAKPETPTAASTEAAPSNPTAAETKAEAASTEEKPTAADESKVKFSKKYG